jgi:hypothetical protein
MMALAPKVVPITMMEIEVLLKWGHLLHHLQIILKQNFIKSIAGFLDLLNDGIMTI